ncbi:MAG: hypothetical protein AAFQ43_08530, partial [Bacteroidota bacterium]
MPPSRHVQLWPGTDPSGWTERYDVEVADELPYRGPLVVGLDVYPSFQAAAAESSRLPETLLVLPEGAEPPPSAVDLIDATATERDWDSIEVALHALARPSRFDIDDVLRSEDDPLDPVAFADREYVEASTAGRAQLLIRSRRLLSETVASVSLGPL